MYLKCIEEAVFVFGAGDDIYLRADVLVVEVDVHIGIHSKLRDG